MPLHGPTYDFSKVAVDVDALADLVGLAASAVADLVLLVAQHVSLEYGVGLGIELLPEDLQRGIAVELTEVVLRHGEHAPGPYGGVV